MSVRSRLERNRQQIHVRRTNRQHYRRRRTQCPGGISWPTRLFANYSAAIGTLRISFVGRRNISRGRLRARRFAVDAPLALLLGPLTFLDLATPLFECVLIFCQTYLP